MRAEILRFLALLEDAPSDEAARLDKLATALDDLASAIHTLPDGEVADGWENEPKPPKVDYNELSKRAARSFPELGYYPWADPVGPIGEIPMTSDAIEDLADIAKDLSEAMWVWDNVGEAPAEWDLHFGYRTHWGEHLHNLRAYLHAVITKL